MANRLIKGGELCLYGTVGGSWWDDESFTASDVNSALEEMSGDITVRLNSGGGSAFQGISIQNALLRYDGNVTISVEALAASAASVIAMAGNDVVMQPGSMMMIHDPSALTFGTAKEHETTANMLRGITDSAANVYQAKSGGDLEHIKTLMADETWLTAAEAVAEGFADREAGEVTASMQAIPVFDYNVFQNAPDQFKKFNPPNGGQQTAEFFADITKEATMSGKNKNTPAPVAPVAPVAELNTPAPVAPVAPVAELNTPAPVAELNTPAPVAPVEMSARDVLLGIASQARAVGLDADKIIEIQTECTTMEAGNAAILKAISTEQPGAAPIQSARVIRDETETRRAGMSAALTAQIMGADPVEETALPFMNMSIVEMAALSVGKQGASLRTTASREAVMNAGFHATSDFPAIFEDAMNKTLLARYLLADPTYRAISRKKNFKDFRPHNMVRAGDFPRLQKVGESGEIKSGTFSGSKETATVVPYAVKFAITRQMLVNDDLGAIDEVLNDYGNEVADFEERTFYAFKDSAVLADGKAVYHVDHKNLASSGSKITVAAIGAGRAAMRKQVSIDKRKINVKAKILLVSPDKETEAEQLVASITADESIKVNPFSGKLNVISPAEMTGNAWELIADPARASNYVWGYLDGYEAPRMRIDEPFGVQGVGVSLEHDFGVGASDFVAGYKNPGAA